MTQATDNGPERSDDDMLAAEYVLGVLPAGERQAASLRIERDTEFSRLVEAWEVRLSPLAVGYAEAEAPASVKAGIDRRLFGNTRRPRAARTGLWSSLGFWRGLAAVAVAALAIYVAAMQLVAPPPGPPPANLVASLSPKDSDVQYVAVYDAAHHELGLSHVSGSHAAGEDFELWMIEGKNAPVSMGVIPAGQSVRIAVSREVRNKLAQGAVLAVSLEPAGGSPTGQPTGPVVAAGALKVI